MKKSRIALAMILTAGLAVAPFAAEAKSQKTKHPSSSTTSSQTTTGANTKSNSNNPSSQGNAGPGTNQGGSLPSNSNSK